MIDPLTVRRESAKVATSSGIGGQMARGQDERMTEWMMLLPHEAAAHHKRRYEEMIMWLSK